MDNYKNSYEQEWQDAFDGAEITPSDNLWNKIDVSLANEENSWFRKRLFFFQLATAASITFALGFGLIALWNSGNYDMDNKEIIVEKVDPQNNTKEKRITLDDQLDKNTTKTKKDHESNTSDLQDRDKKDLRKSKIDLLTQKKEPVDETKPDNKGLITGDNKSADISFAEKLGWDFSNKLPQSNPEIYGVPEWDEFFQKKKNNREALWAGINMSAGNFDPNIGSGGDAAFALASSDQVSGGSVVNNTSQSPGFAYSFGFNIGKRMGTNWIIQSGIQYSIKNAGGSSTVFAEENSQRTPIYHFNEVSPEGTQTLASSSEPINLENTFEFLSIPVQTGYVVIDKKIGWILSGGFSTDFFLKNTLADSDDQLSDVVVKPGDSSPFRTVFFNGLIGTEVIYNLGDHYIISLEPSYKMSLNSLTKPDTDLQSNPTSFILGFRLKYIFD